MNSSEIIKELNDELRALKIAFEMSAYNLVIYTYELDVTSIITLQFYVEFTTEDGADAIASIENAYVRRIPFAGGAKWIVIEALTSTIRVRSMQKGNVEITWEN